MKYPPDEVLGDLIEQGERCLAHLEKLHEEGMALKGECQAWVKELTRVRRMMEEETVH